jgi:hypothetical protein
MEALPHRVSPTRRKTVGAQLHGKGGSPQLYMEHPQTHGCTAPHKFPCLLVLLVFNLFNDRTSSCLSLLLVLFVFNTLTLNPPFLPQDTLLGKKLLNFFVSG